MMFDLIVQNNNYCILKIKYLAQYQVVIEHLFLFSSHKYIVLQSLTFIETVSIKLKLTYNGIGKCREVGV